MAKEVDLKLKKVELKVSVNCCEGCKRKVKKVLQSIEGVFKTEIDSTQPKVTVVLGNIDPQILIKKLTRAGKQVEIWPCNSEKQNPNNPVPAGEGKECGEAAGSFTRGKDNVIGDGCHDGGKKSVSGCDQGHQVGGVGTDDKQSKQSSGTGASASTNTNTMGGGCNQQVGLVETKNSAPSGPPLSTYHPIQPTQAMMSCTPTATLYQTSMVNDTCNITSMVEPCAIPPPVATYCMMPMMGSHSNSTNYALPHQCNCGQPADHFLHLQPPLPLCYPPPGPVSMPISMVGDYFSDENTVGCHVM